MILPYKRFIKFLIKKGIKTQIGLDQAKREFAKEQRFPCPANVELLKVYRRLVQNGSISPSKELENLLRRRRVRSLSGIVSVSVLTKPYPCPGKCLYCPSQEEIPKSYLSDEPAVMRAISNNFDPYAQVKTRLHSLQATGHPTDKIELIIIGGTWSFLPKRYQTWFVKRCFEACNDFNRGRPLSRTKNLKEAQTKNEKAKNRIIGITIETRPDFINEREIQRLRKLGITRVELGVQNIYDDVLSLNRRGHNVRTTINATKLLKDVGFKVCYHIMPNLPGSNLKRDKEMFKKLFTDSSFQPDFLKIYPCIVLKEAPRLYRLWKEGKYKPYQTGELIDLLISVKKNIPVYCRIQRLIRDIPSSNIVAGCKISNLREVILKKLKSEGTRCKCIRCREIKGEYRPDEKIKLFREDYEASGGKEIFLSFEDIKRERIYSLLRLRIPSQFFKNTKSSIPVLNGAALIRELHTYGQLLPLSRRNKEMKWSSPQHKGLGMRLISEAEKIAKREFGLRKIAVIAGIGARDYYRKKGGYKLEDTYMVKVL